MNLHDAWISVRVEHELKDELEQLHAATYHVHRLNFSAWLRGWLRQILDHQEG